MARTLINRATSHVTDPADQKVEVGHIKKVLKANGYKDWIFDTPNQSNTTLRKERKEQLQTPTPSIGLPYIKGLSEELQRIFKDHGVSVYHKPFNTLRSSLVKPKDKQNKEDKCGVIYNVACGTCSDFYIGETARALGKRFEEHTSTDKKSAVLEHLKNTGHSFSFDDMRVLANEPKYNARKIKEAIEIYKGKPTLNRDQGYELPPVLLQLLSSSKEAPRRQPRGLLGVGPRNRTNSL